MQAKFVEQRTIADDEGKRRSGNDAGQWEEARATGAHINKRTIESVRCMAGWMQADRIAVSNSFTGGPSILLSSRAAPRICMACSSTHRVHAVHPPVYIPS